jgi:hypothetical protein
MREKYGSNWKKQTQKYELEDKRTVLEVSSMRALNMQSWKDSSIIILIFYFHSQWSTLSFNTQGLFSYQNF